MISESSFDSDSCQKSTSTSCGSSLSNSRTSNSRSGYYSLVETRGPFHVQLLRQNNALAKGGFVTYAISVRGADGEHTVHRRYTTFELLRKAFLSSHLDQDGMALPPMPSKSVFRKRFCCTSSKLMERRQEELTELLGVLAEEDPLARDPTWRKFLGLPPAVAGHDSVKTTGSDFGHYNGSYLDSIIEQSNDDLFTSV